MKELIDEAESLYKQIDELQGKLAFNLSNDDNETLIRAKCFISNIIDRKDNIVDLGEVWKDGKKENPIPCSDIVIRDCCITSNYEDLLMKVSGHTLMICYRKETVSSKKSGWLHSHKLRDLPLDNYYKNQRCII